MKPKLIFFNICSLGDYLIHSNIIKLLSKKYDITAVCSEYNSKLVFQHEHINRVLIYNKNFSLIKKIKLFFTIFFNFYSLSVVFDLQNFSLFTHFFIFSKDKRSLIMRTPRSFFGVKFSTTYPNFFLKFFLNKFITITRPKHITEIEHLPSKCKELFDDFAEVSNMKSFYYLNPQKLLDKQKNLYLKNNNLKNYLLINFDEKWNRLKNIDNLIIQCVSDLSSKNDINVILSGFNNQSNYYSKIKNNFKSITSSQDALYKSNVYCLDNAKIFLLERFISSSILAISCHSGFLVHSALSNNIPLIDIVDRKRSLYFRCWTSQSRYHQIFNENENFEKICITEIFKNIYTYVKLYR